MTKITPDHLARSACVYIRQSTADQLAHNHESRRRQYGLVDRAKQLGWSNVDVIDDDLGRSGGGIARPGFERLLARICDGRVGAVFAIEASRLARNGRDWHTLIEFCGLVGTLIADEDGIYDPRHPRIDYRFAPAGVGAPELAKELIALKPDVVVAFSSRIGQCYPPLPWRIIPLP
jgi:DNA invertase Pin-like site-specific DNA recombinase